MPALRVACWPIAEIPGHFDPDRASGWLAPIGKWPSLEPRREYRPVDRPPAHEHAVQQVLMLAAPNLARWSGRRSRNAAADTRRLRSGALPLARDSVLHRAPVANVE